MNRRDWFKVGMLGLLGAVVPKARGSDSWPLPKGRDMRVPDWRHAVNHIPGDVRGMVWLEVSGQAVDSRDFIVKTSGGEVVNEEEVAYRSAKTTKELLRNIAYRHHKRVP